MHQDRAAHLTPNTPPLAQRDESVPDALGFALIAIAGYARARRAGLMHSKCKLGDTRVVLAYLSVVAVLATIAIPFWVMLWARVIGG